ncbi:MAG TPA: hypothetical protein VHS32_00850 [Streptosporangiaceae bacterium]|nr:hypothetical protein [Streptosporangiaceae bacterium]
MSGSLVFIKPGFAGLRSGSWSRLVRWIACWWVGRAAGASGLAWPSGRGLGQ